MIVYNSTLNQTQRILVENYLAAKYDLALVAGIDKFAFEATHNHDVAGIGRFSSEDYHTGATSGNILTIDNPADLNDGEYLIFGHDDADISGWSGNEVPSDSLRRLNREWIYLIYHWGLRVITF